MSKKPNQNAKTAPEVIEQPAEIKKSTAELVAILKGPVSGPAVSGPAVSGKSQEVELEPVSAALTADLEELATELMAEPQPKPEPAFQLMAEAKPDTKTGDTQPDTKPDTGVGPGTRFLVKVTGPANKVGRGRYVEARRYLTPWRCQAHQFTSKAEASSFASTLDPAPGLSLQVVGWDKAWAETLPDARWKGTPKIGTKQPAAQAQGEASQAG